MKSAKSTLAKVVYCILCMAPVHAQTPPGAGAAIADTKPTELPRLRISQELLNPRPGPTGIVWSSDSAMLAAYSAWSDLITIWGADGAIVQKIQRQGDHFLIGNPLAFIAHNSDIAARPVKMGPADVIVSVFDIRTGSVVHELPSQQPGQPANFQSALALASSPNGSLLAVAFGGGEAEPVALYDTETCVSSPISQAAINSGVSETKQRPSRSHAMVVTSPSGRWEETF
jgi:WD40 repeat protein